MGRIKLLFRNLLMNDVVYTLFRPLIFVSDRVKNSRQNFLKDRNEAGFRVAAANIFPEKIVRHGPFKGLKLSNGAGLASVEYAKLLGSYEREIHPFLEKLLIKKYDKVINIGCDDGYYALGFAMRMPETNVEASDTNQHALKTVSISANENRLQNQIHFSGTYTNADIDKLDGSKRYCFIVDCEGDEKNIFARNNVLRLKNSDLLIELHLDVYPQMEKYFRELFEATHNISIVDSVDDHLKALTYDYRELEGLGYDLKRFITRERGIFMQWMLLEKKY